MGLIRAIEEDYKVASGSSRCIIELKSWLVRAYKYCAIPRQFYKDRVRIP